MKARVRGFILKAGSDPVADLHFCYQCRGMIHRLFALVLVSTLAAACGRQPASVERQQSVSAPASSWVPPETCLAQASVSLAVLDRKTDSELRKLADHYFSCADHERLKEEGTIGPLEELARRGDARSAGSLATIYKYKPKPDRDRSVRWAKDAVRLGDPRGKDILAEWRVDDRRPPAPPPRSVCA